MCNDLVRTLDAFRSISSKFSYNELCAMKPMEIEEYKIKLKIFKSTNEDPLATTQQKGQSLEKLVSYLLEISGGIFCVERNLRTHTNEIDNYISLTPLGKIYLANRLLPDLLDGFLCECKNYNKSINVGYVGKFYSLLHSNSTHLGIMFSYHGISGKSWSAASGLVRKIYAKGNNENDKYAIIDFSYRDFQSIASGNNILRIIDDKLKCLRLDIDFMKYVKKHPAEIG